ncbi:MAG: YceI family protein [Litorimonas sp.]
MSFKIITTMALALGLVGLVGFAGCGNETQAQLTETVTTAQPVSAQTGSSQSSLEPVTPLADDIAAVQVKSWQVNSEASHINFTAMQEGEPFEGGFENFVAEIKFHPDVLEESFVKVTVPISGIDAGNADRNSTIPGKVWFYVKNFPDAVYTASSFKASGDGSYEAIGELMMKGVSVPLTLPFTLEIDGDEAVMRSTLDINRNDWNIGEKPWNTDEWVSTGVTLDILITAESATPE